MVVLFLIALFLAWPTFGLSLVAYFGYVLFKAWADAQARMHDANDRRAMRAVVDNLDQPTFPSWYRNEDEVDTFWQLLSNSVRYHNVPASLVHHAMTSEEDSKVIYSYVAEMERQGSSRIAQQAGAEQLLKKIWERMHAEDKQRLSELG